MQLEFSTENTSFFREELPLIPMAGDVVGILPENCPEHIGLLSQLVQDSAEDSYFLAGQYESDEGSYYQKEDALKYLSLNPLKAETLSLLKDRLNLKEIEYSQEAEEKLDHLLALHEEAPENTQRLLRHCHLIDLLKAFPGVLSLQDLCSTQGAIYRRVYTISGISRDEEGIPTSIQFLVALGVKYSIPTEGFFPGTEYEGICSSYLHQLFPQGKDTGSVSARFFVQPRTFGAPEKDRSFLVRKSESILNKSFLNNLNTPLLLIAAGSGISGIRAVLQERAMWKEQGYSVGTATLLFGLRNVDQDLIFEEDLISYQEAGILDRVVLAESRPHTGGKRYVQHLLIDGACDQELKEFAHGKRAVLICGDKKMGQSIGEVCLPVLISQLYAKRHKQNALFSIEGEQEDSYLEMGRKNIEKLKAAGFLIRSTSGSRYPKKKINFDKVYQEYFSDKYW